MVKLFFKWIILTVAVMLVAYIIPGITVASWVTALLVAFVLGLINTFIKPVLSLLTIPINILTLGIAGVLINTAYFWFASVIVSGFTINGFWSAVFGSLLVSLFAWLFSMIIADTQK